MSGQRKCRRGPRFGQRWLVVALAGLVACGDPPARQSVDPSAKDDPSSAAAAELEAPSARAAGGDTTAAPERTAADVARAAGPAAAPGAPSVVVRARIVGSDGRLLVGESLVAHWFVDGRRFGAGQTIVGDGEGHFTWPFAASTVPLSLELRLMHASAPAARRESARFALGNLGPGANDLGDLRLSGPPPLVAGRVLDGEGQPVPGALLALEPTGGGGQPFDLVGSDDFGQFEFHGDVPLGDWTLVARATGSGAGRMAPAPFGHMDVELVLGPGASVAGALSADENAPPLVLRLEATDPAGTVLAHTVLHLRGPPAAFRLDGVPVGPVELAVADPGGFALGSLGSFDVPEEGVLDVGTLPLPGSPRQVSFLVTALGGAALESLTLLPTDGHGGVTWSSGEGTLVLPREGATVLLASPGHLTQELVVPPAVDGVAPDSSAVTAELVPASPSLWQLGEGTLPPGCDLGFAFVAPGVAHGEPRWFEGASAVQLAAPFTGAGTVRTWLAYQTPGERRVVELAPRSVHVAEEGARLSLTPPPDELAAALAQLFRGEPSPW